MVLGQLLVEGGWLMVPIYACSVAALAIFVQKWRQLAAVVAADANWLAPLLDDIRSGDIASARSRASASQHPGAVAIDAALATVNACPERASAEAGRVGSLALQRLEKHLSGLSFIAQVAPLLGLLGTVVGMVDLFLDLEGARRASLDVSELSSGIWTALLTTAAGLAVAVPTLAAYSYLSARADRVRLHMHDVVEQALTAVAMRPAATSTEAHDADGDDAAGAVQNAVQNVDGEPRGAR